MTSLNSESFSQDLYEHLVLKRKKLAKFLSCNLDKLDYVTVAMALKEICVSNGVTINELFSGRLGYQCNSKMAFTVFPTLNLYRLIVRIMNKMMIGNLEEFGAGTGLVTYIFKSLNSHLIHCLENNIHDHVQNDVQNMYHGLTPLESIKGSDPLYELECSQPFDDVSIDHKDMCDYITGSTFEENTAVLVVSPSISQHNNMMNTIYKLLKLRKPKLVILVCTMEQQSVQIDGYHCTTMHPRIVCEDDTSEYNLGLNTHNSMYVYIREDINFNPETVMESLREDTLQSIDAPATDLFYRLAEKEMVPKCLVQMKETDLSRIMNFMLELRVTTLPTYLTIDEIDVYITIYQTAFEISGYKPDLLNKRENFDCVVKFTDEVYENPQALKDIGIVPDTINDPSVMYEYVVLDNCFSDKIKTQVFKYHMISS